MNAMFDVEFLDKPFLPQRALIYRMRTGFLRTRIETALRDLYAAQAIDFYDCDPSEIEFAANSTALFPGAYLCNLPRACSPKLASTVRAALLNPDASNLIVFVPHGSSIFAEEFLGSRVGLVVLEEPLIDGETMPSTVWHHLRSGCDLLVGDIMLQPECEAAFAQYLDARRVTLPELVQLFDEFVALYVEPNTGALTDSILRGDHWRERALVASPLQAYLRSPTAENRLKLMLGIDLRLKAGWAHVSMVDELHRLTMRAAGKIGDNGESGAFRHEMLLWVALLIAWTPRLLNTVVDESETSIRPDLFGDVLDRMLRDYQNRSESRTRDPLYGIWSLLREAFLAKGNHVDAEDATREQQLLVLAGTPDPYEPRWVSRLRGLATTPVGESVKNDAAAPHGRDVRRHSAKTLDDIVGHKTATQALRQRLADLKHTPLYFYGPDGVGKETFARVYARAFLCTAEPGHSEIPCGVCDSCLSFETGSFGLAEIDGEVHGLAIDSVRRLLRELKAHAFSNRHVVLIRNPDRVPHLIDIALKTMEGGDGATLFIFCGNGVGSMSATGASRSEVFRLAPLDQNDARHLAERFLEAGGCQIDKQVVDLILEAGQGLPGRLEQACKTISSQNCFSAESAAKALGFEWVADAVGAWLSLVNLEDPYPTPWFQWDACHAVVRMRTILTNIAPGTCRARPPSCRLHEAAFASLESALNLRASEGGKGAASLWGDLARHWNHDHCDPIGLSQAFEETKLVLQASREF